MFVLVIDTSSPAVTAGVVTVGPELALAAVRAPVAARGHGELLAPAFADAIGAPTYAVCSLDAIAAPADGSSIVVTDARRREVYWARYDEQAERVDGPHV